MNTIVLVLGCWAGAAAAADALPPGRFATVVMTDAGRVEGAAAGEVVSFKGIPYAAAPVGALRWCSPQPPAPWTGVRPAKVCGADCAQIREPGEVAPLGGETAEDCLFVNVWRPVRTIAGERLPVLVWIHGVGFVNGGSSPVVTDGSALAREGLVVVSFNYRLGRFGFFAHPALTAAHEGPLGNYGYLDQFEALSWVRRNIAAFGGDPRRVTVCGESAGGASVIHLLTRPDARGLFQQAVVLSGGGRTFMGGARRLSADTDGLPSAESSGITFAKRFGIDGSDESALAALRSLRADSLAAGIRMSTLPARPATYAGGPILGGATLSDSPAAVFQRRGALRVPLLIGTTSADLAVECPPSREDPLSFFGPESARARDVYSARKTKPLALWWTLGADITMHEPARFVAKQMTLGRAPVWLYRFDYVAESLRPGVTGAAHASEVPYLFDTIVTRYGEDATTRDRAAAREFSAYIVQFVKTGRPDVEGLPHWPQFDPSRPDLMIFTRDRGPVFQVDPWRERLDLVERAVERGAATVSAGF
jgi:para-nitrobenzyl esterase